MTSYNVIVQELCPGPSRWRAVDIVPAHPGVPSVIGGLCVGDSVVRALEVTEL